MQVGTPERKEGIRRSDIGRVRRRDSALFAGGRDVVGTNHADAKRFRGRFHRSRHRTRNRGSATAPYTTTRRTSDGLWNGPALFAYKGTFSRILYWCVARSFRVAPGLRPISGFVVPRTAKQSAPEMNTTPNNTATSTTAWWVMRAIFTVRVHPVTTRVTEMGDQKPGSGSTHGATSNAGRARCR